MDISHSLYHTERVNSTNHPDVFSIKEKQYYTQFTVIIINNNNIIHYLGHVSINNYIYQSMSKLSDNCMYKKSITYKTKSQKWTYKNTNITNWSWNTKNHTNNIYIRLYRITFSLSLLQKKILKKPLIQNIKKTTHSYLAYISRL